MPRDTRGAEDSLRTCVVGLGHVGLPTAALIAQAGHTVAGVDRDRDLLAAITAGKASAEPGLARLVAEGVLRGKLTLHETPVSADTTVVCTATPIDPQGKPVLTDLDAAIEAVSAVLTDHALVVLMSTVPVGTTDTIATRLRRHRADVAVAACPERVLPGRALQEIVENPRIAGGVDPASTTRAAAFLRTYTTGEIHQVDARTAELAKLAENSARDVNLAFANTLFTLARRHGVEPRKLWQVVDSHPRVALLSPGIGVGGHCLPVDPWFLVTDAPDDTALLRAARTVNDAVPAAWVARITATANDAGIGRIGLLGLAYKPDVGDVRGSPALAIAQALATRFDVVAADPFVSTAVDGVVVAPVQRVLEAQMVVLLVAHEVFRELGTHLGPDVIGLDACGGWG